MRTGCKTSRCSGDCYAHHDQASSIPLSLDLTMDFLSPQRRCMDLEGGNTADGTKIVSSDCTVGNLQQAWRFVSNGNGAVSLLNVATLKCIKSDANNGGLLTLSKCDGSDKTQAWDLIAGRWYTGGDEQEAFAALSSPCSVFLPESDGKHFSCAAQPFTQGLPSTCYFGRPVDVDVRKLTNNATPDWCTQYPGFEYYRDGWITLEGHGWPDPQVYPMIPVPMQCQCLAPGFSNAGSAGMPVY